MSQVLERNQDIFFMGQFFACYALVELHQREKNGCYILRWKISSHKKCSFCIKGRGWGCIWILLIHEGKKIFLRYCRKIMLLSWSLCLFFAKKINYVNTIHLDKCFKLYFNRFDLICRKFIDPKVSQKFQFFHKFSPAAATSKFQTPFLGEGQLRC